MPRNRVALFPLISETYRAYCLATALQLKYMDADDTNAANDRREAYALPQDRTKRKIGT